MRVISPIVLSLMVASLSPASARADAVLFIYPTLVMFEENQRSAAQRSRWRTAATKRARSK